jgi:phage-related protein
MPETLLFFYKEEDGTVPLLDWFYGLSDKAAAKCLDRIDRLKEQGHEIRRPHADYLRDDIYELRASLEGIHYRMLYFFHGNAAVVVSHGIIKERKVPSKEIDRAMERRKNFLKNPERHKYEEDLT